MAALGTISYVHDTTNRVLIDGTTYRPVGLANQVTVPTVGIIWPAGSAIH